MAGKDVTERSLESFNNVFADIINVLIFGGERRILPEDLCDIPTKSEYHSDYGELRSQERDILKLWKPKGIQFCFFGLENQTNPDRWMVPRIMSYNASTLMRQISEHTAHINRIKCLRDKKKKETEALLDELLEAGVMTSLDQGKSLDPSALIELAQSKGVLVDPTPNLKLTPVVTIVLYFGFEYPWTSPKSLYELMDIPEELKPFVSDYSIYVVEVAWLTRELEEKFQSDFRIVADFFIQMRENGCYNPSPDDTVEHLAEVVALLSQQTDDKQMIDGLIHLSNLEEKTMKGYFTQLIEQSEEKGRKEGEDKVRREMEAERAQMKGYFTQLIEQSEEKGRKEGEDKVRREMLSFVEAERTQMQAERTQMQAKEAQMQAKEAQMQAKEAQMQAKEAQMQAKEAQMQARIAELEAMVASAKSA